MGVKGIRIVLFGLLPLAFAAGYLLRDRAAEPPLSFHDMQVVPTSRLVALVAPGDPEVRSLARSLGTPEAAYAYVRDRIRIAPMTPAAPPGVTLRNGAASCLGKAALLCSLYRAMGIPADNVRIITGDIAVPDGSIDHAWIDLEYGGACLQQDPSGLLGSFRFEEFPGTRFTQFFVQEENHCFNDRGFAVISQLNRFKKAPSSGGPPAEVRRP